MVGKVVGLKSFLFRVVANKRVQPTATSLIFRRETWLSPMSLRAAADARAVSPPLVNQVSYTEQNDHLIGLFH